MNPATPTNRAPAQVRQDLNDIALALDRVPMPRFHDLGLLKDEVTKRHAQKLITPPDSPEYEEACRLLALAHSAIESANQVNANYDQAVRDRKVLTDRRDQLNAELERALIQERNHLRNEAERDYEAALAEFRAQSKALCRQFARMVTLADTCMSFGHKPALPRFTLDFMKNPQDWDSPCTSQQIANGELQWLAQEMGDNRQQKTATVSVGALPLPANM